MAVGKVVAPPFIGGCESAGIAARDADNFPACHHTGGVVCTTGFTIVLRAYVIVVR